MTMQRSSFYRFWARVVVGATIVCNAQAGVIDVVGSAIEDLPHAVMNSAQGIYKGLQYIGRGDAREGVADLALAWIVLNGISLWRNYYKHDAPLKKIQASISKCASEKMHLNMIKEGLREHNHVKLCQGLGQLASVEALNKEIQKLEDIKKQLVQYITIGGSFGIPQEIRVPLVHIYFNRFHAVLHALYKKHIKDNALQSAYCVQNMLNGITLDQLATIECSVESYLQSWTRIWPFFANKPTYGFAAELYWNAMIKIAYLDKCLCALGDRASHMQVRIIS
jgi:hypothetical protein